MMKYLLSYLDSIPDAPSVSDPRFKQLLVDVQAGKQTQAKSNDSFYESLEKVVNELRSSPEAAAFLKPVSKREAPDYYDVIKKPMDLSTVLRNIKAHKYNGKAQFAADLDLIWENCLRYNQLETHALRPAARFMKQKADHHLEFLADRVEKGAKSALPFLAVSTGASPLPGRGPVGSVSRGQTSLRAFSSAPGEEEDAAGESDDAQGEVDGDESFRTDGPSGSRLAAQEGRSARSVSRNRRGTSLVSTEEDTLPKPGSSSRGPFRPKLQANLDVAPALIRTPYSMTHFLPVSLAAGPSFSDKGKAKELLQNTAPPTWYPLEAGEDEDSKLEGSWWGALSKDEAYVAGLPGLPSMADPMLDRHDVRVRKRRKSSSPNGSPMSIDSVKASRRIKTKALSLEKLVHRSVDKLFDARKGMHLIHEAQRIEAEGGVMPPLEDEEEGRSKKKVEARGRKRKRRVEREEAGRRRSTGGAVGEKEAVLSLKMTTASMLAHAGFEGANEIALAMFSRAAVEHIRGIGRTFRMLIDGFSHKMTPEEIVLHALYENGKVHTQDLEAHIKDDIEREDAKILEMSRRVRQAYKEVASGPVIEDDMMFAENGEMLLDGNFADELGEDFLGLRDLGVAQEHGMSSLTVPSSLFYGRRKRGVDAAHPNAKAKELDYPPPPLFIPLNGATLSSHVPALLHAFFAARMESGAGLQDDEGFDLAHSQIGPLGQIVSKASTGGGGKKKKDGGTGGGVMANGEGKEKDGEKKKPPKKPVQAGVGKGNWIRPAKDKAKKGIDQPPSTAAATGQQNGAISPGSEDAAGEEEDAEGEDE